jgi:hypothetical protein
MRTTKPEKQIKDQPEEPDELDASDEEGEQHRPTDYDIRDTIERLSS